MIVILNKIDDLYNMLFSFKSQWILVLLTSVQSHTHTSFPCLHKQDASLIGCDLRKYIQCAWTYELNVEL